MTVNRGRDAVAPNLTADQPDPQAALLDSVSKDELLDMIGPSDADRSLAPVERLLRESGLDTITTGTPPDVIELCLRKLVTAALGADPLRRRTLQSAAIMRLEMAAVRSPALLVQAAFNATRDDPEAAPGHRSAVTLADPEPWLEPVDSAALLAELADWIASYIWLTPASANAAALWVAATWFVEHVDFAPILAVLSATKRCGKSHLLDLLRGVVRRGYFTSGSGVTTAVVFRLNDTQRPTLLIDEAERLAGRHADRDLIGMLNAGYRRGAQVQRCVERNGDFEVVAFDAFGFRALAAIGRLWDTILDRAITLRLERKPRDVALRRFSCRVVEGEADRFARRLARWASDSRTAVAATLGATPRPDWLDDRACDNWAALLAVAAVAGGSWPADALAAARTMSGDAAADAADDTEHLVHDVRHLWAEERWGVAVKSGDLVAKLNEIEGSPWGEYGGGRGLTTHRLASLFKLLGVGPRLDRTQDQVVRGYWRADLEPVFRRYPPQAPQAPEALQVLQALPDKPPGSSPVTVVTVIPVQAPGAGGGLHVEAIGPNRYQVTGGAEPHTVEIVAGVGARCNCRDFQYHGRERDCKHILAVRDHQLCERLLALDPVGWDAENEKGQALLDRPGVP
jgi:uncharacterized protein DUF3631/SWIM zinc finger